jgi:hypothetical protein
MVCLDDLADLGSTAKIVLFAELINIHTLPFLGYVYTEQSCKIKLRLHEYDPCFIVTYTIMKQNTWL